MKYGWGVGIAELEHLRPSETHGKHVVSFARSTCFALNNQYQNEVRILYRTKSNRLSVLFQFYCGAIVCSLSDEHLTAVSTSSEACCALHVQYNVMRNAFCVYSLSVFRRPIRFPLYSVLRETSAFTSGVN